MSLKSKTQKYKTILLIALLYHLHNPLTFCQDTDFQLWPGITYLHHTLKGPDYSLEYQARFNENVTNLKSHFLEGMAYIQPGKSLEFAGIYRLTERSDKLEHRLAVLEWWKINLINSRSEESPKLILVQHAGYQHDFNVTFNERLVNSNSFRCLFSLLAPTKTIINPVLGSGILMTWNDEFPFALDKIRLYTGGEIRTSKSSVLIALYMYELNYVDNPVSGSHVLWLRFRIEGGKKN